MHTLVVEYVAFMAATWGPQTPYHTHTTYVYYELVCIIASMHTSYTTCINSLHTT